MDQHIWQFLVPNKRFKSYKLRHFDHFVPRKRFMRYQMPRIAVFVPRKRFNRDNGTIPKRLKRCLPNFIQI